MVKSKFYSELFKREIRKSEPEYEVKVLAESLYRHYKLEKDKCTCMICQKNIKKLVEYLSKNTK